MLAALFALLLAGCQSIIPRGAPSSQPAPPVASTPPTGPTAPVVSPGLPTDTQRHRVALLVPQSGPDAAVGTSLQNAVMMALVDSRSERVRITTYDTGTGAAAAAQAAIAEGNKLILGPLLADDVRAVAPIARAANVPLISFSNDSSVAGNGVFLMGFEPGQSVARIVSHARREGKSRFGALLPRSTYGDRSAAALRSAVTAAGGTLVASEVYDRSAAGLSGAARRLGAAGTLDALLLADASSTAARALPLLRNAGMGGSPLVLGTELWNNDSSIAAQLPLRGARFASVSDAMFTQMASSYRQRYGRTPYRIASLGYDAVLLTVRAARDWRVGSVFPQNRLLASDGFGGIDGIFRFDNRGLAIRALEVSEVRANGPVVIDPAPTAW